MAGIPSHADALASTLSWDRLTTYPLPALIAVSTVVFMLMCKSPWFRRFRESVLFILFAVVCMNIIGPISAIIGYSCYFVTGNRVWLWRGFYWWLDGLQRYLDVRWQYHPDSEPLIDGPCVYLVNHRSWADFFLDAYIAGGHVSYLSRIGVLIACPPMGICAALCERIIYFRRDSTRDRSALVKRVTDALGRWSTADQRLLCYPEGHRNYGNRPLPLRERGLESIYEQKVRVQIIITKNKEFVVSEKRLTVSRGITCSVAVSPGLDPSSFATVTEWKEAVRREFLRTWDKVYGPA